MIHEYAKDPRTTDEFLADVRRVDVDVESCRKLWCALMMDKIRVASGYARTVYDPNRQELAERDRKIAIAWFRSEECSIVCEYIGISPDLVREWVKGGFPDFKSRSNIFYQDRGRAA